MAMATMCNCWDDHLISTHGNGNTRGNEYSEATATETHGNAQLLCAKSPWPRGHGEIELRCADLTNSAPIPRAPLATSEFATGNSSHLGF